MTTPKGTQSGDYELSLILDGLYYAEAKQTCSGLADADAQYAHTESRLEEINAEILEIEGRYERREDAYDETESLCIQSVGWWDEYQSRQRSSFAVRQQSTHFAQTAWKLT